MKNNTHKQSSLGDFLLTFRRNMMEIMKKEGLTHELTFTQLEVLHFISPDGAKTMRSIADYLKITPPSTTALIADMEKKNLVKRASDPKDRRIVSIVFTHKMKKLFVTITKRKEEVIRKMFSKLSDKDQTELERIIKILINQ